MKRGRPLERRSELQRKTALTRSGKPLQRRTPLRQVSLSERAGGDVRRQRARPVSEASPAQRAKCRDAACVVCRRPGPSDPAHLIDRGLLTAGQDDPLAVIPLCRQHHDAYDAEQLDLLPYLEPHRRDELAFAVQRYGLVATLRRVTNDRDAAGSRTIGGNPTPYG